VHRLGSIIYLVAVLLLPETTLFAQSSNPGISPTDRKNSSTISTPSPATSWEGKVGGGIKFQEISSEAGLNWKPHSTSLRRYIMETMGGGGIAALDCNNDGKLDLAVVNDSTIDAYLRGGELMVTLYRQDGMGQNVHFTNITESAGLTTKGWGTGIAVGDYDNDGLPDLYVTGYGHNVLYHNLGNCKFEDVTARAGVAAGGFSEGAAWADFDRDGHLDLFVARYVETDIHHLPEPGSTRQGYKGVLVDIPGPMKGQPDLLFRNRGDGTFEEVSNKSGVGDPDKLKGMGVVWGDYDNDGWPDLFVTNDGDWNYLYRNRHNGSFDELGITSGTGIGEHGESYGNMAADFADFDHDGKLDLVVTRYANQPASLYWNQGNGEFKDIAPEAGIAAKTFSFVKWGTGFGDFDNDGWADILIANGNFSELMDSLPGEVNYREPLQLFRNLGNRTFEEAIDTGLNDGPLESRRGTAFGDFNNDGKLDVAVFNAGNPPSLFINETRNNNHSVLLHLVGTKSNRSAIGARVTVQTAHMTQMNEVRGGGGYLSTNDPRLHFGLGTDTVIEKVEIRWPSGAQQEFRNISADAIYEIEEGQPIRKTVLFPPADAK
jgi:hypothetical protein